MILNLKTFLFTRVNGEGKQEQCFVTYRQGSDSWDNKTVSLHFRNFTSPEESQRKIKLISNGGQPTPIKEQEPLSISLSNADFLAEGLKPAIPNRNAEADYAAIQSGEMSLDEFKDIYHPTRIENQSNAIWDTAWNYKFIPDFSLIDEDGARVEVLKSLNDLGAIEIPVQIDTDNLINV